MEGKGMKCGQCKNIYKTMKSLKAHIKTKHETRNSECYTCGMIMSTEKELKTHEAFHKGNSTQSIEKIIINVIK